jgi:hypothetical protein
MLGTQRCSLVFTDEKLGEFMQDVEGICTPSPLSTESFLIVSSSDSSKTQNLSIPSHNKLLDLLRIENANIDKSLIQALIKNDNINYKIELTSQFFTAPKDIIVPGSVLTKSNENKSINSEEISQTAIQQSKKSGISCTEFFNIPVTFQPKNPGEYFSKLILISPFDVRVHDIKGFCQSPDINVSINMIAHSRKTVIQDIPILNTSNSEWNFTASIIPTNTGAGKSVVDCIFHGNKEFRVRPKETYHYSLQFSPIRAGVATAELTFRNVTLQNSISLLTSSQYSSASTSLSSFISSSWEKMIVSLNGEGLPPPPEQPDIVINCVAKVEQTKLIKVPPVVPKTKTSYRVVCDLACCSGVSKHVVEFEKDMLKSADYELVINSVHAGTENGYNKIFFILLVLFLLF